MKNKSKHGGTNSENRLGLFLFLAVLVVCIVAFVGMICNNGRPITVDEESAAAQTNVVAEVVTSAPPTEKVVDQLIAVTTVTNTNTSYRISLKGKVKSGL